MNAEHLLASTVRLATHINDRDDGARNVPLIGTHGISDLTRQRPALIQPHFPMTCAWEAVSLIRHHRQKARNISPEMRVGREHSPRPMLQAPGAAAEQLEPGAPPR